MVPEAAPAGATRARPTWTSCGAISTGAWGGSSAAGDAAAATSRGAGPRPGRSAAARGSAPRHPPPRRGGPLPGPSQPHETVNLAQVRTLEVGYRNNVRTKVLKESLMLTDDENIVDLQFAVQYTEIGRASC